jgi:Arm DNA-binding domain
VLKSFKLHHFIIFVKEKCMNSKQSFSILILPVKYRVKNGKATLSVRITINGQRSEFAAHREVSPKLWDSGAQRMKGNTEEARSINAHLEAIKIKTNIIKNRNAAPAAFGSVLDQLFPKTVSTLQDDAFWGLGDPHASLVAPVNILETLHARTASGFGTFGEFYIGNDRQAAKELFDNLKGSPDDGEGGLLIMELREINRSLLFDIQMIHYTLDQMCDNCRLITKNQFKTMILK